MAKDASVAPKERVNIRFKPATGDAKEEVELPMKLLVVGDFTQQTDDRQVEDRPLSNIDKDNFQDVLRSQNLKLTMSVPNVLDETEGSQMPVSLKFESMKDFEPDQVAKQVPELAQMLELRAALLALKAPLGNLPAFRKTIEASIDNADSRTKLLDELGLGGSKDS